jgi:hypothetical protein
VNRKAKYDLLLSRVSTKPVLKVLLTQCRDRNWKATVLTFRHIEAAAKRKNRPTCSDAQATIFHAMFYIVEGIEELDRYTNFLWNKIGPGAIGMMQLLGHR